MDRWLGGSRDRLGCAFGIRREPRGMTSIELLVAAVVLTIGLLGVLSAFGPGYTSVTTAGRQDRAVALAYDKFEELKNYPWDHPSFFCSNCSDQPATGFTRTWKITKTSTLATVQITVAHRQIPNAVNLVSYIVAQ